MDTLIMLHNMMNVSHVMIILIILTII